MPDVQSIKKQLHMQQWTAIIEDRIASGLKIDEYCEKNQLCLLYTSLSFFMRNYNKQPM